MSAGGPATHSPVLVVAADYPSSAQALALADQLAGFPVWLKVGLELFTAEGPDLLQRLGALHFPLFLDLKFHDIPNTVQGATRAAALSGVRMLTLHLAGGEAMCRAAVAGRAQALSRIEEQGGSLPLLMGVSVLTSEGADPASIQAQVLQRAILAQDCGLDGIVCSGFEVRAVKERCGRDFLCLTPGIRFTGAGGADDQARVCSPAQAVREGADFIVMGRPVTRADSPVDAVRAALANMREGIRI